MREIKFRAKVKYNGNHKFSGDWIYGYYRNNENGNAFITETLDEIDNYIFEETEVEEDTIGQYTGLKDKNGKEIYEGDILQQIHYVFSNDEYDYKGFKKLIIQVLWGQKEAAFIFKVIKKIDIEMPKDYKEPYREVIGNIYDNPELLEV